MMGRQKTMSHQHQGKRLRATGIPKCFREADEECTPTSATAVYLDEDAVLSREVSPPGKRPHNEDVSEVCLAPGTRQRSKIQDCTSHELDEDSGDANVDSDWQSITAGRPLINEADPTFDSAYDLSMDNDGEDDCKPAAIENKSQWVSRYVQDLDEDSETMSLSRHCCKPGPLHIQSGGKKKHHYIHDMDLDEDSVNKSVEVKDYPAGRCWQLMKTSTPNVNESSEKFVNLMESASPSDVKVYDAPSVHAPHQDVPNQDLVVVAPNVEEASHNQDVSNQEVVVCPADAQVLTPSEQKIMHWKTKFQQFLVELPPANAAALALHQKRELFWKHSDWAVEAEKLKEYDLGDENLFSKLSWVHGYFSRRRKQYPDKYPFHCKMDNAPLFICCSADSFPEILHQAILAEGSNIRNVEHVCDKHPLESKLKINHLLWTDSCCIGL